jgi:hypothetical protein
MSKFTKDGKNVNALFPLLKSIKSVVIIKITE